MEDLTELNEPLNPYAKVFFGLWALVVLFVIGLQSTDFSYEKWPNKIQADQTVRTNQVFFATNEKPTSSARLIRLKAKYNQ